MEGKIIDKKLILNGFVYVKSKDEKNGPKTCWDCRLVRQKTCKVRAITTKRPNSAEIVVLKGGELNSHEYPPNQELCRAKKSELRSK
ncbi:hypothetical protein U1Q18_042395 [Sarracenia purpurea var. burkii]